MLADEPIDLVTLQQRMQDEWAAGVERATKRLIEADVLPYANDATLTLSRDVAPTLRRFILETAQAFSEKDPYLAQRSTENGPRTFAFNPSKDGAARLFGTDARLRNLMALAVHDPLMLRELRRITGANHMTLESRKVAQFGRGELVRVWKTDDGPAIMLDPAYPLARPLQRLLVALERAYPLPLYVPEFDAPEPPPRRPWHGDRNALFGGIIPTTILTSIGVHGWTFEALCVAVCIGHDRWNIKKAMRRLEDEGVLQGGRPRGPGMDVRTVRIADDFPAKAELQALLEACTQAWPGISDAVKTGFEKIAYERPRTKAHLKNRGLWPY